MPGQEKMVMDYYQKNPSAVASLRGAIYEEKIIDLIKKQITLIKKTISSKEALEILNSLNKKTQAKMATEKPKKQQKKSKIKTKK